MDAFSHIHEHTKQQTRFSKIGQLLVTVTVIFGEKKELYMSRSFFPPKMTVTASRLWQRVESKFAVLYARECMKKLLCSLQQTSFQQTSFQQTSFQQTSPGPLWSGISPPKSDLATGLRVVHYTHWVTHTLNIAHSRHHFDFKRYHYPKFDLVFWYWSWGMSCWITHNKMTEMTYDSQLLKPNFLLGS